jgi:hypothetical protein
VRRKTGSADPAARTAYKMGSPHERRSIRLYRSRIPSFYTGLSTKIVGIVLHRREA